jgi:4-amino-4-deoxy-L-arabinose transferase-like glycosyltransferase
VSGYRAVLAVLLLTALAFRLWAITAGVPHAVGIDEPAIVGRALRILRTGDWNPHIFDYPTLVIYLHTAVALLRFMAGASRGEWGTLADFDIAAVYLTGRVVSACLGTATVWLTYRIGREAGSDRIGLLAAAQLAVLPMHVRESHFILTDVPLTALTTLTVYLAARTDAGRSWIAGATAGLAAAAKYNGGVVLVAAIVGVLGHRAPLSTRLRLLAATVGAAAAAFLLATPFAVLDLPTFLNSFGAQMERLARARGTPEPAGIIYLKHFALSGRLWLPLAAAGLIAVLLRRTSRGRWMPALAFAGAYFYILATHPLVFARYALPLTPIVCLLAAAGIDAVARLVPSVPALRRRSLPTLVALLLLLPLLVPFAGTAAAWNRQFARRDTRQMTADWIRASLPAGTRLAVENSGPTYLGTAGFEVTEVELLVEHPLEWYAERRIQYLVVSSGVGWTGGYADAGARMLDVPAAPDRLGPPIRIVRLLP